MEKSNIIRVEEFRQLKKGITLPRHLTNLYRSPYFLLWQYRYIIVYNKFCCLNKVIKKIKLPPPPCPPPSRGSGL